MSILLGFAPFILFALLANVSADLALWTALSTAFVLAIRDFAHTRILRLLDVGSTVLFGVLALYTGFIQPSLSVQIVRLVVDGGLLALGFVSIVTGNPFTLDYVREEVPQEFWRERPFLRMNYVIASAWTLALAVMTAADAAATFNRKFPLSLEVAAGLAALSAAVIFTARYPTPLRLQAMRFREFGAKRRR